MPEWEAEHVVDAGLARRLVAEQFPRLGLASLTSLGEGWDATVWLVNGRWVFRFPRRQVVIAPAEREFALLGRLAPLLPVPIPQPVFAGRPAHGYPWPFYGAPYLEGDELAEVVLSDADRAALAPALARFLRALHDPATLDAFRGDELPVDANRRSDMGLRVPWTRERLATIAGMGLWTAPPVVAEWLDAASRLEPAPVSALVHGDLHFRHLLVAGGRLAGVIDWIDLGVADRAVDLLLHWCLFDPAARRAFRDVYGPIDDAELLRSRVLAVFLCATLAEYGRREGLQAVEREAVAGLERTVIG
jgi:aminoglycoside phosphotransferase (APT) family kinase protein